MSETCLNCVQLRLKNGCNCIDAEEIPDEMREAFAINHGQPESMHEMLFSQMTPEELEAFLKEADESMLDGVDEIDFHEFHG